MLRTGAVECWGDAEDGALGNGNTNGTQTCHGLSGAGSLPCSTTPLPVSGISNATAIASGGEFNCAVLRTAAVQCWGDNYHGQLAQGTTTGPTTCQGSLIGSSSCSPAPLTVPGLRGVTAIAAAHNDACALTRDNHVECWGDNSFGQLGDGTAQPSSVPVRVQGI